VGGVNEIEGFLCTFVVVVVVVLVNNSIFHMLYQWSERERERERDMDVASFWNLLSFSLFVSQIDFLRDFRLTAINAVLSFYLSFFFFFFPPNWMTTKCRGAYPIKLGTIL
jgi:hypothetical protein